MFALMQSFYPGTFVSYSFSFTFHQIIAWSIHAIASEDKMASKQSGCFGTAQS